MVDLSLPQIALIVLSAYVLWRLVSPLVLKNPLANIRGPRPVSWWKGSFDQNFNRHAWDFHKQNLKEYGGVVRMKMLFGKETLYVSDPLALHHIVVKDQYIYEETGGFLLNNGLIFGPSLLSTLGDHHRKQRKMLNPVFSLKHMRGLIPVLYPIAHQLRDILERQIEGEESEVNVMKWMSRAALEYIGQGGLGYSFQALDETKVDTFSEALKVFGPTNFGLLMYRQFLPFLVKLGPPSFRRAAIDLAPFDKPKTIAHMSDIINAESRQIFQSKKQALAEGDEAVQAQVGKGKDILSVLIKANMDEANKADRLPEEELLGQMGTFIIAGADTTTSAACRVFHLLALNPRVQERLREEITAARQVEGDLEYDTLMNLPYLDAVCRETLRLYAPVSQLTRCTRQDVVMPLLWPIKGVDGSDIREIAVPNNTDIIISVFGANRDKRIWGPDAEEWRPERWLEPLPQTVADAHMPGVYASMMTFIGGGRACIGFKFAEMELKMVLSVLLETLVFKPGPDIFWSMSNLALPTPVGQKDFYPRLPVRLSLAKKAKN